MISQKKKKKKEILKKKRKEKIFRSQKYQNSINVSVRECQCYTMSVSGNVRI